MKNLPIGIQTFPKLINERNIYVDKTKYLFKLITTGNVYFLSRPRRFGKSLLVSTLKEIFSGNKKLFKGYWIYNKIKWEKYPIIHLDFSKIDFKDKTLSIALIKRLNMLANENKITLSPDNTLKECFEELIMKMSGKKQVVILIDEYDKPIIDYLDNIEKAKENQGVLKNFYSCLKGLDENIKFLFITGVSKFSQVSIFSDLNHLDDITTQEKYSTLLGYTEEEIIKFFPDHLCWVEKKLKVSRVELMKQLKQMYNGYKWHIEKETVYNPFSILKFLNTAEFKNYWFSTGTPTFLVNYLRDNNISVEKIIPYEADELFFEKFEIENIGIWTLMFQTGYLTIKKKENDVYILEYPNKEVQDSFLKNLLQSYCFTSQDISVNTLLKIHKSLDNNNLDDFVKHFNILFAGIPYELYKNQTEFFYHAIIHTVLSLCGVDLQSELEISTGRIDTVIKNEKYVYIVEFKMGTAQEALEQIKQKEYDKPWRNDSRKVQRVGIGFHREKRAITEYLVE